MHNSSPTPNDETDPKTGGAGYEVRDVQMRVVVIGVISLVVLCAGAFVASVLTFRVFTKLPPSIKALPPPIDYGQLLPPEPRLQPSPPKDLKEFRASEEAFLNSYGWMDRKAGIVRIPIDRAIDLVVERGLPHWDPVKEEAAQPRETATQPASQHGPASAEESK